MRHIRPVPGEDGEAWCEAARQVADDLGVELDAVRIGHTEGDYLDPRCRWLRHREIEADGAILVRPDRFVAWRSFSDSSSSTADLESALQSILFRDHSSKGTES